MTLERAEKELLRLCRLLGLVAEYSDDFPDYSYVAGCIFYVGAEEHRVSNLAHEVAHYLVASRGRRRLPDFGLGGSPDSLRYTSRVLSCSWCMLEEKRASALGIMLECWAGASPAFTLGYHSWNVENELTPYLGWLGRRALLRPSHGQSPLDWYRFDEALVLPRLVWRDQA